MKRIPILPVLLAVSVILNIVLVVASPKEKPPQVVETPDKASQAEKLAGKLTRDMERDKSRGRSFEKAIQERTAKELNLIRRLASEEKAEKTIEAIDRLLKNRKLRLQRMPNKTRRPKPENRDRAKALEQRRKAREDRIRRETYMRTKPKSEIILKEKSENPDPNKE